MLNYVDSIPYIHANSIIPNKKKVLIIKLFPIQSSFHLQHQNSVL